MEFLGLRGDALIISEMLTTDYLRDVEIIGRNPREHGLADPVLDSSVGDQYKWNRRSAVKQHALNQVIELNNHSVVVAHYQKPHPFSPAGENRFYPLLNHPEVSGNI